MTTEKLPEKLVIDRHGRIAEKVSARVRAPITPDTDRQTLRAIVRRYNSNPALLAAAEKALAVLERKVLYPMCNADTEITQLRAAIKLATGKEI